MAMMLPSPAGVVTFVGCRVGGAVIKAACTTLVAGRLTPEVLGEALVSSSTVRAHAQAELLQYVALRVSLRSPRRLAWFVSLLTDLVARTGGDGTEAVRLLGRRAALHHVTAFGIRGTVASALAALAVQTGTATFQLLTTNARPIATRGKRSKAVAERDAMSLRQYRYLLTTAALTGAGTVVGSGVGAALGSMVVPGFGTVVGSMTVSAACAYLPTYLRAGKGPDDLRRRQIEALRKYIPLAMEERKDGFVELFSVNDLVLEEEPPQQQQQEGGGGVEEATDSVVVLSSHRRSRRAAAEVAATAAESSGGEAAAPMTGPLVRVVASESTAAPPARGGGRLSSAASSEWSDVGLDAVADAAEGRRDGDGDDATPLTALGGQLEVLPAGLCWEKLNAHVDSISGEDELVLVFRVDEASQSPATSA